MALSHSAVTSVFRSISKQDLEKSNGKDLAQVLNDQAGLIVNGAYSNPGKDKSIFLRGAKTDYTVILVNGIPVSDPSGTGGAFDIRMFPVDRSVLPVHLQVSSLINLKI